MMSCPEYQDLIAAGDDAGQHLNACADCRDFLADLQRVDAELSNIFGTVTAAPDFNQAVLRRIQIEDRLAAPSVIPEVLDSIGWLATAVGLVVIAWLFVPLPAVSVPWVGWQMVCAIVIALIATIAATWNSLRVTPLRGS